MNAKHLGVILILATKVPAFGAEPRLSQAGAVFAAGLPARAAEPRPIEACVPADVMAVLFNRPYSDTASGLATNRPVENIGRWLLMLKTMGLIPQQGRVVADIVGTLPLVSRRPYALFLLDATAKQLGPASYRLNDMKSGVVIDSEGIGLDLERRVRDLLGTYTDAQNGRIETVQSNGVKYYRLTEGRLPGWAVTEWGNAGQFLVITFGQGTFERVLSAVQDRAPNLAGDGWYAQAHLRCSARQSGLEIYLAVAAIEKRLESMVNEAIRSTLHAVELDHVDKLLLAIGFDGRALHSEVLARDRAGRDQHMVLTGKEIVSARVLGLVPESASSYVAFRLPLGPAVRKARQAYLAGQSPERRQRFHDEWTMVEREHKFDTETGLIDHLGEHLVLLPFPRHPLGIPLLGTVWIETTGDKAETERTVDGMMRALQHFVEQPPAGKEARSRLVPQVQRDPSGMWYLQLGLLGPAVAVTDGWIVISFSPEAVRENVAWLRERVATQTQPSQ